MSNRNNLILALIVLVALIAVLVASGAGALLWQFGTNVVDALGSFFQSLIAR
jgi:hypothetical protein